MSDPWSSDDSGDAAGGFASAFNPADIVWNSGGTPHYVPNLPDPNISTSGLDFGYPLLDRNAIGEILNKGLGPLSLEAINGSLDLYLNPRKYFADLRANNPELFTDTVSGGDGGDLTDDAESDAATRAHEFDKFYTPTGSLLAGDQAHTGAVPPAPVGPAGSMVGRDPVHPPMSEGEFVTLPDGSQVPDEYSWTGYLMSPKPDLGPVATAGRQTSEKYDALSSDPNYAALALPYMAYSLGIHLGHGGTFDYQREGNIFDGYRQHPQFRDVSNVNVGLFGQQAGLSLDDVLLAAGAYARVLSSNANADKPYGLNTETMEMIKAGYDLGRSGVFDPSHISQGGG